MAQRLRVLMREQRRETPCRQTLHWLYLLKAPSHATGAAECEFRQLTESAAKLACGMLGMFKVNASAFRSGTGVAIALAIFQTALANQRHASF